MKALRTEATKAISRRTILSGFAATAGAALLAACGGGDTPAPTATRAAGTTPGASGATSPTTVTGAVGSAVTGSATRPATTGSVTAASVTTGSATTSPATTGSVTAGSATATRAATTGSPASGSPASGSAVAAPTVAGTTSAGAAGAASAVKLTGTVRLASKDFTEEFIVGNMYRLLLEAAGAKVDYKQSLGGTPVCQAAMEKGDIDLYPEYTGTGLATVLKQNTVGLDGPTIYSQVAQMYKAKYNFVWLDPAPMNDTQALAMTAAGSQKFGITTISQMVAKADQITMIGPTEFQDREDGIPGLQKVYGNFKLKKYLPVDPGLKYQGLLSGQADVSVAFGTDGDISVNKLVVLKDDKNLFPVSQITPVVTQKALDANPGIRIVLNTVAPLLTDDVMSNLNYQVDGMKQEPAAVAKNFLTQKGLLK